MSCEPDDSLRHAFGTFLPGGPVQIALLGPLSTGTTSLVMPEGFREHVSTTPAPGWYVVCEPLDDPWLVRMDRLKGPRWRVDGVNLDTGEPVENAEVLFVLGPATEDAAPFLMDHVARRAPWEHHRMSAEAAPAPT